MRVYLAGFVESLYELLLFYNFFIAILLPLVFV